MKTEPRSCAILGICDTKVSIAGRPDDEEPRRHPDQLAVLEEAMCQHQPRCPSVLALDRTAARVVACHAEQGWSLLCNGVVFFDDGEILLLDERAVFPDPVPVTSRAA